MFFKNHPYTTYELNGQSFKIKDIFRKASFITEYKPFSDLYTSHTIADGETPSSIADDYYDSNELYWVVMVFNEIHNMNADWPLDQASLTRLCESRYGAQMFNVRHWEIDGIVMGEVFDGIPAAEYPVPEAPSEQALAVSFYEYEERLNDAKRTILILRPELVGEFVSQYKEAISG